MGKSDGESDGEIDEDSDGVRRGDYHDRGLKNNVNLISHLLT